MATQYELYSSYLKDLEKEQSVIDLRQMYTDLLTSSLKTAETVYATESQVAAQQASYDISGAYANYLKQQRNIAAQGRLESGYKEEVSDVLQQQYQGAFGQARATQVATTAKAYESYLKSVEDAYATSEKNKGVVDKLVQERASRAATFTDLYNQYRGITNAELLESSTYDSTSGKYPVFTQNKSTGEWELTDFGKDWYAEGLTGKVAFTDSKGGTRALSFEDWLKESGDEKQIEEWQKHSADIMKDIAGIEYAKNNKGELTLPKYDETVGKTTKLKTKGYIESQINNLNKLELNGNDLRAIDFGESGKSKITDAIDEVFNFGQYADIDEATLVSDIKEYLIKHADALKFDLGQRFGDSQTSDADSKALFIKYINRITDKNSLINIMVELGKDSTYGKNVLNIYDAITKAVEQSAIKKYRGA